MRTAPLLLLVFALPAQAQTSVLFIGNSYIYSNDLPNTFRQLALSLGETVTVQSSAPGGYTLYQHSAYAPTLDAINAQPWDFVVMQEQSQLGALPSDVTSTEYGMLQLMAEIEANWECTYPVLYMTWGRENGDPQYCANHPFMCTYEGMQQALRNNYVTLANFNDAWTSPVGVAWATVRAEHPTIDLYVDDGSHPSVAGTYLAACVFYCTLFHEPCTAATFNSSLDPATAATLRGIASSTVLDEFETWNLDLPNGTDALLDGFQLGADFVTLIHNGAGEHLWTCTNGQSFTTGTCTFTFATSGSFVVTHTYNDPCGNTDTRTFTFDMTTVGLAERTSDSIHVHCTAPGTLTIHGAEPGSTFDLYDVQGKLQASVQVSATSMQLHCAPGIHVWSCTQRNGSLFTGRTAVLAE